MSKAIHKILACLAGAAAILVCAGAEPRANHVILLSMDGLNATLLQEYLGKAPERFPHFSRLLREGAGTLNARCDYYSSETVPNHTSMLLGRPVLQPDGWPSNAYHGYLNNGYNTGETYHRNGNTNAGYLASVFDVVHDHGLVTAFFAAKSKLAIAYQSYNQTNGAPDIVGEDNGRNKVDYAQIVDWVFGGNNRWTLLGAVTNYLADQAPNFMFLHFADLDYLGHYYGWGSATYSNTMAEMDICLGALLAVIEAHPQMGEQTAILLTADHGGGSPYNSHITPEHPLNYTIPFLAWGPGWPGGRDLYHLMANRFDPDTNRLDYLAPLQPIRNSDAANLAMILLDLPPVPGSSIHPRLGTPAIQLSTIVNGERIHFTWPGPATDFVLEVADGLSPQLSWRPVTEGIQKAPRHNSLTILTTDAPAMQLFRLRLE